MKVKYVAPISNEWLDEKPDEVPYLGLENIESGTGRYSIDDPMETVESTVNVFHRGQVLFGKLRPYLAKVIYADFDCVGTTELVALQPCPESDGKYLFYHLLSEGFIETVNALTYGTKMPRANPDQIGNISVCLPPLPEQRTIAAFLDRETTRIDALIEKKQRLIDLLQEKRTALISHAVTKGLDPSAPMKASGVEWLGEIPAHWQVVRVGYCLHFIGYGFTNPMPVAESGPFMLTANDIGNGEIFFSTARRTTQEAFDHDLTDKSRPQQNDVLVTKDGTLGRVAVFDGQVACINQSVAVLRPNQQKILPIFLEMLLRAHIYQDRMIYEAGGTTIKHIYITRLAKMPIAVPDLAEQGQIVTVLAKQIERINNVIHKVSCAINHLQEYRTALISAAVTGKIDVRNEIHHSTE